MAENNNERWNQDNRWAGEADYDQERDRSRGYREARFADEERSYGDRSSGDKHRGGGHRGGPRVNQDIGYGQGSLATGGPAATRAPGSFSDYGASSGGGYGDGYGPYGGPAGRPSQTGGYGGDNRGYSADNRGYGGGGGGYRGDSGDGAQGLASDEILDRQARGEGPGFWGRMFGRDRNEGEHRGRGPKDYKRSDQRISDDVHDRLTDDSWLDAQNINVAVKDGEVTLSGAVASRDDKRRAEQLAENVSGVDHVQNNLRVGRKDDDGGSTTPLPQV